MTDTPQGSGADLARQALAAARAAAKTQPVASPKKPRRTVRPSRGEGRDPQTFGGILERLRTDHGWDAGINGGNLIDQWPSICPAELATTVRPTAYDPDRGLLTLQPSTPAYATQVRLFQQQLIRQLNDRLGKPAVRAIRVLPPGGRPGARHDGPAAATAPPAPEAPVKTREVAHPGYRQNLALARDNRYQQPASNGYEEEARQRQIAALRANRLPDSEDRDAYWAQQDAAAAAGPAPGSMAASEAAAIAYKRSHAAGRGLPRRAFDVA